MFCKTIFSLYVIYMELLIVGGIAAAGWALSGRGIETRAPLPKPQQHPADPSAISSAFEEPVVTSKKLQEQYDQAMKSRWQAAQNPQHTGIIAPFFTSARKQNTSDPLKQRTMEMYTGADISWKPKRESASLFDPTPQAITSSGTAGNSIDYDSQRQETSVSGIQTNVLPFQVTQVGPGIGTDPSVPASDGFHSMYRPPVVDATAYRTNTLEGRIIPGGAAVTVRPVDPQVKTVHPPRFYTMERLPPVKGRATVTASTRRPDVTHSHQPGCHVVGDEYFGGAGRTGPHTNDGSPSRDRNDDHRGLPQTNVHSAVNGPGGFTNAVFDDAQFSSQQREMSGCNIAPGYFVPTGTSTPQDHPQTTLREQLHGHTNGFSAAAPVLTATRVQCTDQQLLKEAKRGGYSQAMNTYVTGAERNSEYARDKLGPVIPKYVLQYNNIRHKNDSRNGRIVSHPQSSIIYANQAQPGKNSTEDRQRLPEINTFQDFSIAKTALQGNDLAIHIN